MSAAIVEYRIDAFELRPREGKLLRDGRAAPVGSRALKTLICLVEVNGKVVGKDALLGRVWPGMIVGENNLHAQVSALRKALGEDGAAIASAPGRG